MPATAAPTPTIGPKCLLRMYLNWAKDHDCDIELLDRQDNEQAGINSGHHRRARAHGLRIPQRRDPAFRLIRTVLSTPKASGRPASPPLRLARSLRQIDIMKSSTTIWKNRCFGASGPGGQHVNKTSSAVPLDSQADGNCRGVSEASGAKHKNPPPP